MKKYTFLFKPIFFIFNLVFATWLVLKIEQIQPSDFGKYKSVFDTPTRQDRNKTKKEKLQKLLADYKSKKIDLAFLEQELQHMMEE
jgi:hypothetical protein